MLDWWEALSTFEKIYWYIAIPFSVILLIQLILTFVGMGDADGDFGGSDLDIPDADVEIDLDLDTISEDMIDSDPSGYEDVSQFSMFTIRNFIAFFTLFGWGGIAAINNNLSTFWVIVVALISGLIAMSIVAFLFYSMSKLQDRGGELRIKNAINKIGSVYLPISAKAGNVGKVQIKVQGGLKELQAVTMGDTDLSTGSVVKVTGVINNILVVEKVLNY